MITDKQGYVVYDFGSLIFFVFLRFLAVPYADSRITAGNERLGPLGSTTLMAALNVLPQHLLGRFARIPHDAHIENMYYGVFCRILSELCFAEQAYLVEPYYPLVQVGVPPTIDFVVTSLVDMNDRPIFFIEIKPPRQLNSPSGRITADTQMRERFHGLRNDTPVPTLHGISAIGRMLAFYSMDVAANDIEPAYVEEDPEYVTDTVPEGRWEVDITTEIGYQQFMAVINQVRDMVAVL